MSSANEPETTGQPPSSDIRLRGYLADDLEAMFRLDELCFEPVFRFSRTAMRRFAEAKNACVVIAEHAGELAGFCIVNRTMERSWRAGYVVTLDVAPAYRRTGVATQLMRKADALATALGWKAMLLHVFNENAAAIRFYEREGYQLVREEPDFYGSGVHALVYRKPLG